MLLHNLSKFVLKYPKLILGCLFTFTMYFGYTAFFSENKLQTDFSVEQLFPESDPEKDIYEAFIQEFPREDAILFLVYKCEDCMSRDAIQSVSELTEDLEFLDDVIEVTSLTTIMGGDYLAEDLSDEDWENNKKEIISNPLYTNLLTAQDGEIASIIIKLDSEVQNHKARKAVMSKVEDLMEDFHYEWHAAGIPFIRTKYVDFVMRERDIFIPLAFLVSVIVLFLVFRQLKSIILSFIAISTTLIWISGIMAMLGISVNVISYLTYNLLTIIGVSDCIHILIKYHEKLYQGCKKLTAVDGVIREIGAALFITSFTTAIGFLSLFFTNIRIIQEFGFIVGFGVILMFIFTIIIVPVLLSFIEVPDKEHIKRLVEGGRLQTAERLNKWILKHPKNILAGSTIIITLSIVGLFQVSDNFSIFNDFRPGNEIYESIKFVDNELGGVFPVDVLVETDRSNGVIDPELLTAIDEFQDSISTIYGIGSVKSIIDILKVLNREDTGEFAIPENIEDIQSYLILSEDLKDLYISDSNHKTRVTCRVIAGTADEADSLKTLIHQYADELLPADCNSVITGSIVVMLKTNKYLVKNLLTSFILAFIVIFFSMMFLFRSKQLALISIFPNIIPLMFAGGVMGLAGIILRPSTAMTFSIALGIAVDDTIHFLARFRQEYKKFNGDYTKAINRTLLTTGKAIISTTIVISLGFIVMLFSAYVPNFEFALLGTIILVIALAGSLILLPVLIMFIKPKFRFRLEKSEE